MASRNKNLLRVSQAKKKSLLEGYEISQNTRAKSPIGARGNYKLESCQKARLPSLPFKASWSLGIHFFLPSLSQLPLHIHFALGPSWHWPQLCIMVSWPRKRHQWVMVSIQTPFRVLRERITLLDLLYLVRVLPLVLGEPMGP